MRKYLTFIELVATIF